MLYKWRIYTYN